MGMKVISEMEAAASGSHFARPSEIKDSAALNESRR